MKKVLVSIFTLILVLSISLSAFAAPVINYSFENEEDGTIYVFGSAQKTAGTSNYVDSIAKDFGIELLDKDGNTIKTTIGENDATVLANIVANDNTTDATLRKFGFGLVDESDRLGDTFIVRPFFVVRDGHASAPAIDMNEYGKYYTADTLNGNATEANYRYVEATYNAVYDLNKGKAFRSGSGMWANNTTADFLRFDISSIPADAKKVTASIGMSYDPTATYIASVNTNYTKFKFYTVDKGVLDWNNNGTAWTWTTAPAAANVNNSTIGFEYIGVDAEGYKTAIKAENLIASVGIAGMEKITYGGSESAYTNKKNGVIFVADITDAVLAAKEAGETVIDLAVVQSNGSTTLLKNVELNDTLTGADKNAMDQLVPRINYVK